MKYKITVNHQVYDVELDNINARPVIAYVDGERFEVMPENADQAETGNEADGKTERKPFDPNPIKISSHTSSPALSGNSIAAPLPGIVIELFVKPGEKVETGQVVVIIEAMKMKNSIRSMHSGTVSEVLVSAGQSVAHKQTLIKFVEPGEASWI